jgi:hypothetical protein
MHRRRITRTLGAAAGGLLGVVFLPAAVAFADDYDITPDPSSSPEVITGLYGLATLPPPEAGSTQGDQLFDFTDTTTGASGTFNADESTGMDDFGFSNEEVFVTSDGSGADAPPVGSVFDTYTFGHGGFENIYADVASTTGGADVISDTLVTPFGDYTIPGTFDAADFPVADAGGVTIGNGDVIDPVGTQTTTAIGGIPPVTVVLQGDQLFDVDNAAGTAVGSFDADETTTTDAIGTYTEAVLVTKDLGDTTVGTAAGDTPAVGSIFNTIDFDGIENFYSDVVSTTGGADVITDTVETPLGDFTIPTTFDAAQAEDTAAIDLPDGEDLDPTGTLDFTGVNGLPPIDVDVQGTQTFDVDGSSSDTFTADVTNTLDPLGISTETVLVTSSSDPDAPVGSVIETVSLGAGFENIYSDLPSTTPGADVISDTLVTPFGDIALPASFDAVLGLASLF